MHWILVALFVVAAVAAVVVIGLLLPKRHEASSVAVFEVSPEVIWDIVASIDRIPQWRSGVSKVERLPDREGKPVWRETDRRGQAIAYEVVELVPPRRMVRRIADPDLPFGGSWTIDVQPHDGGTKVTITERGEVYNPVFRFVSRFIIGHTATMEKFLAEMGQAIVPSGAANS